MRRTRLVFLFRSREGGTGGVEEAGGGREAPKHTSSKHLQNKEPWGVKLRRGSRCESGSPMRPAETVASGRLVGCPLSSPLLATASALDRIGRGGQEVQRRAVGLSLLPTSSPSPGRNKSWQV